MIQRVKIDGVELPRLYIVENNEDMRIAKENGIPYIKWNDGIESLIKILLRPTLEKMFPHIDWYAVLGRKRVMRTKIYEVSHMREPRDPSTINHADYDYDKMIKSQLAHDPSKFIIETEDDEIPEEFADIATGDRSFSDDHEHDRYDENTYMHSYSIEQYIGDLSSSVDIDVLQRLALLPKFVGDVSDCIRVNLSNSMHWTEGYNKKLGVPVGKFDNSKQLPNLIILDISASIPRGISATMITLIDTMRNQCDADLIITSRRSGYYPMGTELPSPDTIKQYYGTGNEGAEFASILEKHIAGREFGHVISFGDNDNPIDAYKWGWTEPEQFGMDCSFSPKMMGTKVHKVHHYHTCYRNKETGYAMWVKDCCPDVDMEFDTNWARCMKD